MIDRRGVLGGLALAGGVARSAWAGREEVMLWPSRPPGGGGPSGPVEVSEGGAVRNVSRPSLEVFTPAKPNGSAVIVAAGGGYTRIERGKEAYPAARWLTDRGVTAFVLTYRLPGEGWEDGPLAPLQDAQRALRTVRAGAADRRLDPQRIGVLGFSAGGHLLGLAAARSAFESYGPRDAIDRQPAHPAFAALLYPVVTLERPYQHTSTCRVLVGRDATPALAAEWSVQTHVRRRCPPMFLAQADDDRISDPANSRILAQACEAAGVPVEWHPFATGGHGFAMGRPGTASEAWPGLCQAWLQRLGVLA
jgi:acetyl esterase/lipase